MAAMRAPRARVGSASWVAEERSFALQVAQAEAEEFSYSARNELDWFNEHMAGIFDENEMNLAETFKTPGKLRGKHPHTERKQNALEARVPLSDVFGANPKGIANLSRQITRPQSPQALANAARKSPSPMKHSSPRKAASPPKHPTPVSTVQDSGYFGRQDTAPLEIHVDPILDDDEQAQLDQDSCQAIMPGSNPSRAVSTEAVVEALEAKQEEEVACAPAAAVETVGNFGSHTSPRERHGGEDEDLDAPTTSPSATVHPDANSAAPEPETQVPRAEQVSDDARSPSDGSSPMRPIVRKSSLNFASLPAREPLTAGKSVGARVSRTSHLDHVRTSYYNRPTGGKSLGKLGLMYCDESEKSDEMDVDEDVQTRNAGEQNSVTLNHAKTYTQRLQDQINMLGKSQSNDPGQPKLVSGAQPSQLPKSIASVSPSPVRKPTAQSAPGAFPNDDDDDLIEPPATVRATSEARPALPKNHSTDVVENQDKDAIEHKEFEISDHAQGDSNRSERLSSVWEQMDYVSDQPNPTSQSTLDPELQSLKHAVSNSRPSLRTVSGMSTDTPPKSLSRTFRDSPLKQVKNKLSSILKSSKGLLASSAAVSAEGKSSMMSPTTIRPGFHANASSESLVSKLGIGSKDMQEQAEGADGSPVRPPTRRTRASVEREKKEKRIEAQNEKLDKAREQEREKASVFSREQERIAAMEKQISSKKAEEKAVPKETPKPTRSSPRKFKAAEGKHKATEKDAEMEDALANAPPPSVARSIRPGQSIRSKETRRPMKPAKDTQAKAKQVPTVIRVNTGSQSQYHTSSRLSTASYDTADPPSLQSQNRLVSKSSKASLHAKSSAQGLRAPSSVSRPKTLDLMAKKKELDEREAQRRRDVRTEMERKRAAAQEDQRKQEQWRRQETERQRQQDYQLAASQNEGKTPAQRRAALEKAKQTKAPPPAARSQANGPLASAGAQEKIASTASSAMGDAQTARPQSRMTSNLHRSQDEASRPVPTLLSNTSKAGTKRALDPERSDEQQAKRGVSRGGPAYQANEAKRRTSDAFEDDAELDHSRNIKGPPVRPSGGYKKDLPPKPTYGYANAPHSATRDLFKATVTAQHNNQAKATHPLDMAQISKGAIPFAPNANAAGPTHKTPARSGAYNGSKSTVKSVPRSSPRFQNGESIELPEIQTDDEDEDNDEASGLGVAAWADSPDLRQALMLQETMDPSQIFGPPSALNMEEVFHKSKDRWHKFRARTSSANWSGADRLTEEDVRKDLAARDKLRREGGWSYEMSKEML